MVRRHLRILAAIAACGLSAAITAAVDPLPASADITSDQSQIAALQSRITRDGELVQQLVSAYDAAQAHVAALAAQLDAARARVDSDRRTQAVASEHLRQLALDSYMSGADDSTLIAMFDTSRSTSAAAAEEYSHVASEGLNSAIDAVAVDVQKTQAAEAQLRATQTQAEASAKQLDDSRQAAEVALNRDNALLTQVQGNLQSLLAAAAQQRLEAERAQEAALAAAAQAAAQAAASHPITVTFTPTPGTYANPLRAVNALTAERIDQGVDYSGFGPIYAVGDGVVLSTVNAGWPGGTFISYRLTDGPAAGLVVYAAEDIDPFVAVGQAVSSKTPLGAVYEGPSGIETGWADRAGNGTTMANDAGQFSGANSTAFGANFSQLLGSLGAPHGIPQNDPPTGTLPSGWPTW